MPYLEFEVWCSCGNGLCNQTKEVKGGIMVEPCEKCLEKEYDSGYDTGHNEGYAECEKDNNL